MDQLSRPDLQTLETAGGGALEALNYVATWLHQEGFYAAENALLTEVENRYPDHASGDGGRSPARASLDSGTAGRQGAGEDTVDLMSPAMARDYSGEGSLSSVERWGCRASTRL